MTTTHDIVWYQNHFRLLAEGGVWGVPRSGLIFAKRGEELVLTERMPYLDEIAEAYARGEDVPESAEALAAYQDEDYELIRSSFEEAGITVKKEVD